MKRISFKKHVSVLVAVCLITCSFFAICCNVTASQQIGDINGDGKVSALDMNILKRAIAGSMPMDDAMTDAADIDGNGKLNSKDTNLLSRCILGKYDPELPDDPVYSDPTLVVSNKTASKGDTVTVTVDISNNPGILAMMLSLNYDDEALSLTDVANGDAVSVLNLTKPGKPESPCNFIWDGVELAEDDIKDGTVLTLTFEVADDAQDGTYGISFSAGTGSVVDNDLMPVELDIVNGSITVK